MNAPGSEPSLAWTYRPLAGPTEFVRLRGLVRDAWRMVGILPFTSPGPLDWWRALDAERDLLSLIELWEPAGARAAVPLGWTWLRGSDLEWFVSPSVPDEEALGLRRAMLHRHIERSREAGVGETSVYATDGAEAAAAQSVGGRVATNGHALVQLTMPLPGAAIAEPGLPAGYSIRPVDLATELEARVEMHRAAFAPSKFTTAKMRALLDEDSAYDPSHDLVVVAPDGSFAGFAVGWVDREASVGEIEPLGVHPDHRGKGIAGALVLEHLRRFQSAGLATATIWHAGDNPAAEAAYRRAGLKPFARAVPYALPLS